MVQIANTTRGFCPRVSSTAAKRHPGGKRESWRRPAGGHRARVRRTLAYEVGGRRDRELAHAGVDEKSGLSVEHDIRRSLATLQEAVGLLTICANGNFRQRRAPRPSPRRRRRRRHRGGSRWQEAVGAGIVAAARAWCAYQARASAGLKAGRRREFGGDLRHVRPASGAASSTAGWRLPSTPRWSSPVGRIAHHFGEPLCPRTHRAADHHMPKFRSTGRRSEW